MRTPATHPGMAYPVKIIIDVILYLIRDLQTVEFKHFLTKIIDKLNKGRRLSL